MKRLRLCLTLVLALSLVTVSLASAGTDSCPRILPPFLPVEGLTSAEWLAVFSQAMFSIPAPENPGMGAPWTDCFLERIGNLGVGLAFFLPSGTFNCQMPAGMTLFQPIVGAECSTLEGNGETWRELRQCAQGYVPSNVQVTIDGFDIPYPGRYVVTSPLFRLTLPDDNVLGLPAGSGYSVAHGVNLMIAPLSVGLHTMHLHGEFPSVGFVYDWDYNITVTP